VGKNPTSIKMIEKIVKFFSVNMLLIFFQEIFELNVLMVGLVDVGSGEANLHP
jgi:hypothetical protein